MAPIKGGVPKLTSRAAHLARPVVAAGLHLLPVLLGDRGRRHAEWRATRALPSWLDEAPATVRVRRQRLHWELDLRDNVQRTIYYTGHYEPELGERLQAELTRPGAVYLDIGAHVGAHALPLAQHLAPCGGKVIAFEPAPDTARKLRATARRSQVVNLHVVEAALGDRPAQIHLRGNADFNAMDAGVRSKFGTGQAVCVVPVVVFDQWAQETSLDRLDVVKIDVEGAEYEALSGMKNSLGRLLPRLVVVELMDEYLRRAGASVQAIADLLSRCGYDQVGAIADRCGFFRPRTQVPGADTN